MKALLLRAWLLSLVAMVVTASAETNSPVRSLGGGLFMVGEVLLNKTNRAITFSGSVNQRAETVEYVVVHKTGKTHESVLRTTARPQDVHVALLLLGVEPAMTNSFGADGKGLPIGTKVRGDVVWTNGGARVQCAMEDLVLNRETSQSLPHGDWIYNGSNFSEGSFTAQRDGSIVSIRIDPDALINNPRPGRENDDLHVPNAAKLPPIGTPVSITLRIER